MKHRMIVFSMTACAAVVSASLCVPWNTATAADTAPATNGTSAGVPTTAPPAIGPVRPGLSFGANEVVKMSQGGISKEIILNYINSTALPYHLSAEDIISLHSLAIPEEIIKALILRDGQLQQLAAQQNNPQGPTAAPPHITAQEAASQPLTAQAAAPVMATATPAPYVPYDDTYSWDPYYYGGYPCYYGPSVVIGGGWGWGGRYHGGGYRGGGGGYHGGFGGGGGFHGGFGGGGGFHGGFGGGRGGGGHR